MNYDNEPRVVDISKSSGGKNRYSIASLILSAAPLVILMLGFLFCFIFSRAGGADENSGAIWWVFVALLWIMIPVTIITNILSVIFGIKGIKANKTRFAWGGISIVALELLTALLLPGIKMIVSIPAMNAYKQELLQQREEIEKAETYADLTQFGLGIYKLQAGGSSWLGDPFLWDITQPEEGIAYGDIDMIYDYCRNLKAEETWDDSNRGKDVTYDVKRYEGTYIIIHPEPIFMNDEAIFYINICKELNVNADLFQIVIEDQEVIEKLHELPGEKLSRRELVEKLSKTKWEDVPRK